MGMVIPLKKWDDVEDLSKLETGYYDLILLEYSGCWSKKYQVREVWEY